jgi:succinylarginine dihydrolase
MKTYEVNMDGLVGLTHNYAGLAQGNVASIQNALHHSNPQEAALQGLEKMRLLHNLGIKQGLLPPHERPNLRLLSQLGFQGSLENQLKKAYEYAPELLSACYSASAMWAANTATVSPSRDTQDNKTHFTAANLISNIHRYHEADFSQKILQFIFSNSQYFQHHPILPRTLATADEGAANHNRICQNHSNPGIHLFVYGKKALGSGKEIEGSRKYPARQTREAFEIIRRTHQLPQNKIIFARQNPEAIDLGVFHNDVISVANESVFLVHEQAFYNQKAILQELKNKASFPLTIIELVKEQVSIQDAVSSYLFNSQIISLTDKKEMVLIAPIECCSNVPVKAFLDQLIEDTTNPINSVHYLDLRQSMRNGGGPACLRLRVPLTEEELKAMHPQVLVDNRLLDKLKQWVIKHYRTELKNTDLVDPQLIQESFYALDELTQILKLGSIYPFQSE